MTYWFLLVRQINAGVVEGESNKCGGLQREPHITPAGRGLATAAGWRPGQDLDGVL
jgi:hypothetical protein